MTRHATTPAARRLLSVLLLAAGAVGLAPAGAQVLPPGSGFDWERVGDFPMRVQALAFGPDSLGDRDSGILWASGGEGIYRLDASASEAGTWVQVWPVGFANVLFALSADTLFALNAHVARSTNGGRWWEVVAESDRARITAIAEIPPGVPHAGRLVVGDNGGIQNSIDTRYSDDRGATWQAATTPDWGGTRALAVLPAWSSHPGRIAAGTTRGASYSDDGGQTYHESALWGPYSGERICLIERPGVPGSVRVLLEGYEQGDPGNAAWWSDDGGATWEGPGHVPRLFGEPGVYAIGAASALTLDWDGTVYRTDDGGQTWAAVGRAPDVDPAGRPRRVSTAAVSPDNRLYVGLSRTGPGDEQWVYRTEPLVPVVASAPGPDATGRVSVSVRPNPAQEDATVVLTLAQPSEVSVSVYDSLGRAVAVLHRGPLAAGTHALAFEGSDLPVGRYVVRAEAGQKNVTAALVLVR